MSNRHQKTSKSGGFYPHFERLEQNKNKENGYLTENKGFLVHYSLEFYPNLWYTGKYIIKKLYYERKNDYIK